MRFHLEIRGGSSRPILLAAIFASGAGAMLAINGCGSSSASTTSTSTSNTTYVAAYKALSWGAQAIVTFPTSCSMMIKSTGVPTYHNDYYLAPTSTEYPTTVVHSPGSNTAYSVVPYTPSAIVAESMTINICPEKASSTTSTQGGTIGYVLTGEALFNGGDGAGVSALSDQASYTFTQNGTTYTAYFIDQCNSHPTPLTGGYNWHHHGVPNCLAATVDGDTGPSHIIGVALDGYPIYGGRDINGKEITTDQLDACNGLTSATPEFPSGAYHYVLPIGVTSYQSSIGCYAGTVSSTLMAQAFRRHCDMRTYQPGKGNMGHPMKPNALATMTGM